MVKVKQHLLLAQNFKEVKEDFSIVNFKTCLAFIPRIKSTDLLKNRYLISRIFGSLISRGLIFAIAKKKLLEKKGTKFRCCVFVFILRKEHLSQINKTYTVEPR